MIINMGRGQIEEKKVTVINGFIIYNNSVAKTNTDVYGHKAIWIIADANGKTVKGGFETRKKAIAYIEGKTA